MKLMSACGGAFRNRGPDTTAYEISCCINTIRYYYNYYCYYCCCALRGLAEYENMVLCQTVSCTYRQSVSICNPLYVLLLPCFWYVSNNAL